jgi:hypothetical protein
MTKYQAAKLHTITSQNTVTLISICAKLQVLYKLLMVTLQDCRICSLFSGLSCSPLMHSVLESCFSRGDGSKKEPGSRQGINTIIPNNRTTPRLLTPIDNFKIQNTKFERRQGITHQRSLCETCVGDAQQG